MATQGSTDCGLEKRGRCEDNSGWRGGICDEACGALTACKDDQCEARDCHDDRECVAFTGRPDGVCAESGQCSIPRDNDEGAPALGPLFACVEGSCTMPAARPTPSAPRVGGGGELLCA